MNLNPYLMFVGQCEAAFKFYEQCLGGKIVMMMTYADAPMDGQTSDDWKNKIVHARMIVGGSVFMGADAPPDRYSKPAGMYVSLIVDTPEEAERIYQALAEDATIHMPMEETFFAHRFGMLVDRFGTPWMINCEKTM